MEKSKTKTVAIYARVSTKDQNVDQQKKLLVDFCRSKNWNYRSYIDDGVSGTIDDRPAWVKLLKDCEKGEYDTIVVTKFDRITRSLKYAIEFYEWFSQRKGLKLISLYDNADLETADGYFSFMLKCLLSEYELLQLAWRRQIGIERAKREGKYKGGKKGRRWAKR